MRTDENGVLPGPRVLHAPERVKRNRTGAGESVMDAVVD